MGYQETLIGLADDVADQVIAVWRSLDEGLIEHDDFVELVAKLIAEGNGRARSLADLAMAAQVAVELGEVVPVAGVDYPDDTDRLRKAATSVLATAEASGTPEKIIVRLARSEPLEAAAKAATDAMIRGGKTKGWVRQMSPGACQLCRWWSRDGRVWPAEHPFQHHKGCACTPRPVVAEGIRETWKTARAKGIR